MPAFECVGWLASFRRAQLETLVHQSDTRTLFSSADVIGTLGARYRGTFLGQAYGPFSEISAVWDTTFGAQSYSALAAGIAGMPFHMPSHPLCHCLHPCSTYACIHLLILESSSAASCHQGSFFVFS